MRSDLALMSLNRGVVSPLGLGRQDVKRLALAAQKQTNWMPRVLGAMALRVGWGFLGGTRNDQASRMLKFIFASDDTALLEMTDSIMRVWIDDALLQRPAVSTAITNGLFAGNITGWTGMDEAGATSAWAAGDVMSLVGSGTAFAIREQQVSPSVADRGIEHGVRVVIERGPVLIRIGSTSGDDDYVSETTLGTGTHSLSITPTGDFFIRFFSRLVRTTLVKSCTIEAAGVVTLPTPWTVDDLGNLRPDQSGDVVYVACEGAQQRMIQRRGTRPHARSWSVVPYAPDDGPFQLQNVSPTTITATGLTGDVSLIASTALFKAGHVGALFSLTSEGQAVTATGAANGVTTASIRVTGVDSERVFSIDITGDATGSTVNLQRSTDDATWSNVSGAGATFTANASTTFDDSLDNQIIFYRLILTTRVAPDTVTMTLRIGSGSIRGIVRVTQVTNSLNASGQVLVDLGSTDATEVWQEGQWSDVMGWPTAVKIHEGRMWWCGLNGVWGSISDAYDSFDETVIGSAGPINRTIGSGPVDTINWLLSLKGLMLGAQGTEYMVRASSLDEPLTPTNFNVKSSSTQGSGPVDSVKVDQSGYFVDQSSIKVFSLGFDLEAYDYSARDMMALYPDLGSPGIVRMDCQRRPDTRLHCVRSDGTAIVCVVDRAEDQLAWIPVETSGFIEDVVVLPAQSGQTDDQVYYVVRRTIGGASVRYLEKWAQESDCQGGTLNCLADSYVTYSGTATTVITGLSHLEGREVVVWADGADVGTNDSARPWTQTYTVSGAQITLPVAASTVVVGLGYTAQFKSAKLGLQVQGADPQSRRKKGDAIGLLLVNTHRKGVKFGPTLDDTGSLCMDDMPQMEQGTEVTEEIHDDYDEDLIEFPGTWTPDLRVCLQAQAPRPATVLAIAFGVQQT